MNMRPETADEFMKRYPRITAHIIAESLGYATPTRAAQIGLDGLQRKENWCEYVYTCFNKDARACLQRAIMNRHHHSGFMAEYRLAKMLVDQAVEKGKEPIFASWF